MSECEGFQVYALCQASIFCGLRDKFTALWYDVPQYIQQMNDIMNNLNLAEPGEFNGSTLLEMQAPWGKEGYNNGRDNKQS